MSDAAASSGGPVLQGLTPEVLMRLATMQMPYGKHKGALIADLPGNYLAWFAREGFPRGELGRMLALMLEIDHNGLRPLLDPLRSTPRAVRRDPTPAVRAARD